MPGLRYRLALDLGSNSLGWALIRLAADGRPVAIIRAGVRIFSDGRNPKDGSSLAVTRRAARAMRRRRDRLLRRKARVMRLLLQHGFFPQDESARKDLERLDPYRLRAEGLERELTGPEFARAIFHINQRRGFKSNRRTDKKENESGALKQAINQLRTTLKQESCRTVGEWLHRRHQAGLSVRARFHQNRVIKDDGKTKIDKSYDFYVDRQMVADEFDALWEKQASLNRVLYNDAARAALRDALLFQRELRPVKPGRCTLIPEEPRAPLALPSTQRFRIYQEVNNLRILQEGLKETPLTLAQRDAVVEALEQHGKRTFDNLRKLLNLPGTTRFNLEDPKRTDLRGNATSAALASKTLIGKTWHTFDDEFQDEVVRNLLVEEDESRLLDWLVEKTGVDADTAERIANARLPDGYGSLSAAALGRILPELRREVVSYAEAAQRAGFHHSRLSENQAVPGRTRAVETVDPGTGEIRSWNVFNELPYYGEFLQRHVGFADPDAGPDAPEERRFGRIANPTVHIGLNQTRRVVNALIARYGHPSEIIVELARELKLNQEEKKAEQQRQAENQKRNDRLRESAGGVLGIASHLVARRDLDKLILWEELSNDAADRRCPYSGIQISMEMLLSDQVEIEHILPFSQTLDDSLNNKTVAIRAANRVKGNRTPWEARPDFEAAGWTYEDILVRAQKMPRQKRYRFGEDGYQRWLNEDKDFLARALNDTRYLSRVAREYMSLICPMNTRVIPGRMTALLRGRFGLNDVLGLQGEKNRNDHRHHAVDACVIGVTDQGLLQAFARASASARERQLERLVESMPLPWSTYRDHVSRAVRHIWVSHRPDHGHQGAMHEDTAYRPPHRDSRGAWRTRGIGGEKPNEKSADSNAMVAVSGTLPRYGGPNVPFKGYVGGSNYCMEIVRGDSERWEGEVISTFKAYQIAKAEGADRLRHPTLSLSGKPLVMRLMINDSVRLSVDKQLRTMRVATIKANGQVLLADLSEANVDARNRSKSDEFSYISKFPGSLRTALARKVTVSPIGDLRDPGFPG